MSTPRLPFLWPSALFKPQPAAHRARTRRNLATTSQRAVTPIQRYGPAFEPPPHLREGADKKPEEEKKEGKEGRPKDEGDGETTLSITANEEELAGPASFPGASNSSSGSAAEDTTSSTTTTEEKKEPFARRARTPKPEPMVESVLHMPSPTDAHKAPHLKTPPFVHHFDTYGLVKQLVASRYSEGASVTVMKAVRGMLIENMMLARRGLVSKSNVENETYLFSAACAELRTEVGNLRKAEMERMRTERDQLQHEVDILGQKLGQETGAIKDELKGLFDDRKMAVRQEQRTMETKIQELNYQITIKLNSDARSEVEGLRWVLTRRIAMGISIMACMLIVLLQLNSSRNHAHQEKKKAKAAASSPPSDLTPPPSLPPPTSENPHEEALGGEILATEGVSLG